MKEAPVVVVVPGDLHLTEAGLPNHVAAEWAIGEINELIRPDFVQFIGDNVQDGTQEQFKLFRRVTERLAVPWFALVGDHDVQGDPNAMMFREHVGEPFGSHAVRGFRFLRLNTQEARPVGLSSGQLARFRHEADLALAAGERLVVFQHNYPYQIWENYAGPGIDGWREVVQTRRIQAILCGHTHYWQVANDGRNVLVATRSIGDPEGGPAGYTIAIFHGDDFAVRFRSIDERGPLVMITHPLEWLLATGPEHVVRCADEVRARVWSKATVEVVECSVNGAAWTVMHREGDEWCLPLPEDRLAKGTHSLVVRVRAGNAKDEHSIDFCVDPSGRYTAVPLVRPIVSFTSFC